MSKQAVGWGCALVAVVGLWTTEHLTAQEESPFTKSTQTTVDSAAVDSAAVDSAAQRINATLKQRLRTSLNYEGEQLDIILEAIADEYDIPIIFDRAALEEVAISPESEVNINLRNISLRAAINLMLKEPGLEDLCYLIDEEVLLITTHEKRNETLAVRVYRVDDLLEPASRRFNLASQYGNPDHLMDIIIANVMHDSWQENGSGEGEIHFYPPGMIVISQTRHIHDEIEKLLDKLRHTKQQILSDARSTASIAKPATRGFVLDAKLGEKPEQAQQRLAAAIKSSVDWSEGDLTEQEIWIHVLPNRVLVRHLPTVLRQVEVVLADMRLVNNLGGGVSGGGGGFGIGLGGGSASGGGGGGGGGGFF